MSVTKAALLKLTISLAILVLPSMAYASEWFLCGNLGQLSLCQLPSYPTLRYEYGIAYNTDEPLPIACTGWNVGRRVQNKQPYFVYSDNPANSMKWGGFVFYTGTHATDDDECQSGTWRHRYWWLDTNTTVTTASSNGCINQPIYCRIR